MKRYLLGPDARAARALSCDVLIVGSGIAGLYAALNLDEGLRCLILCKEGVDISNSWLAQGGIAAAVAPDDRPELHLQDTLTAGAGLCDEAAVRVLVDEGPSDIARLLAMRVPFDLNEDGDLETGREGGHRMRRIVHAHGDATGRETVKVLAAIAAQRPNIEFLQRAFLIDLLTRDGRAAGALVHMPEEGCLLIAARAVVLCTGGIGQIYEHSTNPSVATGDGLAAALRAGAALRDMEFVQFHPTGLYAGGDQGRSFLISEAMRGEGARLLSAAGERFMVGQHPLAELAPRDIVARAVARQMRADNAACAFLDITFLPEERLRARFPTIFEECRRRGIEIARQPIPVCPVQHYMMGGIEADLFGRSRVPGLYACGEAARTGVHGANRLASNSMLECLVFGRRAARCISGSLAEPPVRPELPEGACAQTEPSQGAEQKARIRRIMSRDGWIIRSQAGLARGLEEMRAIQAALEEGALADKEEMEALNMATVACQVLAAALARNESVGAHYRED